MFYNVYLLCDQKKCIWVKTIPKLDICEITRVSIIKRIRYYSKDKRIQIGVYPIHLLENEKVVQVKVMQLTLVVRTQLL